MQHASLLCLQMTSASPAAMNVLREATKLVCFRTSSPSTISPISSACHQLPSHASSLFPTPSADPRIVNSTRFTAITTAVLLIRGAGTLLQPREDVTFSGQNFFASPLVTTGHAAAARHFVLLPATSLDKGRYTSLPHFINLSSTHRTFSAQNRRLL